MPSRGSRPQPKAARRTATRDARGFAMLDAYLISIASLSSTLGMAVVFLWVYRR
jgi:hypothetical protein